MRPRFTVVLTGDVESARRRLEAALAAATCPLRGGRIGERIELTVPEAERHTWSPHLSVVFEEAGPSAVARGRFGPHPHLWTLFVAIYAHLAFVGLAGAVYGGLVYLSAFLGQGLGADEMYRLRAFVEEALTRAPPGPPDDPQG